MAKDWFRNKTWSPEIETAFQEKLKRSRIKGPQHLYTQAAILATIEPKVALKLLEQYFTTTDTICMGLAFWTQAIAYQVLSRYDDAVAAFRGALSWETTHPHQLTRSYVELPYLLAVMGRVEDFEEAISILHDPKHKLVFPSDEFLYGASMALIYQKQNKPEQARPYAIRALQAAKGDCSPFWKYPSVGLEGSSYAEMQSRIWEIAFVPDCT